MSNEKEASNLLKKVDYKKLKKKRKIAEKVFIILLLLYPIGHWIVFWLYTNLRTFAFPFMEWDYWEARYLFPHPEGLFYNFKQQIEQFFLKDTTGAHTTVYIAFFNTFHSLAINFILLPLATIIGFALAKHVPGEKFFRVVFFLPNILSTVVLCLAFRFMFESNTALFVGPGAKLLQFLGFNFDGWNILNKPRIWTLVYIFCIWAGLSINVVLISSAFQRIPKEIIEAARMDGIGFFQEFFKIGLPLIMPTITTFLVNAVTAVTVFYLQPYLLLGGYEGGYQTIPWLIFNWAQEADQSRYILIATIGIMFSAIMFPIILLARYIGRKLTPDVEF